MSRNNNKLRSLLFSLKTQFSETSIFYLEIMIGGPQPSGGMEGLKSQLKSGSAEGGAEGSNGVTEGESVEGGDDKGTPPIQSFQYFMKRVELIGNLFH